MPILTPEEDARQEIDRMLEAAGGQVQTRARMNITAAPGVAVCEFPLTTGEVDYLLFAQGRSIGVVQATPAAAKICVFVGITDFFASLLGCEWGAQ